MANVNVQIRHVYLPYITVYGPYFTIFDPFHIDRITARYHSPGMTLKERIHPIRLQIKRFDLVQHLFLSNLFNSVKTLLIFKI